MIVVDDMLLLREGLVSALRRYDVDVVGEAASADGLLGAVDRLRPDVVVLDIRMPPTFTDEGLRAAIAARAGRPGFPVLVLSQYVEQLYARELLASGEGAVGYLLKDRVADVAEFVDALHRVAAGATVLDPSVVAAVLERRRDSPLERLTDREREVLALMAEGRANAGIAQSLVVTEKAVAKHINSIFAKLDLPADTDDHRRVRAVLAWLGV